MLAVLINGCASSRMSNHSIDALFRAGQYDEASTLLKKGLEEETEEGSDGLLYLLDLGISEHQAGHFEESIKALRRADALAEIKDYTRLSSEAGTLFVSENSKAYKGEEFENILINVYLALNYSLIGKFDDALIECRRVNRKLYLMRSEGKRSYPLSAFATYFSGVLYEAKKEWNDAYISYKQTRELMPTYRELGPDLIRMAKKLKMQDEVKKWEAEYSALYSSMDEENEGGGEELNPVTVFGSPSKKRRRVRRSIVIDSVKNHSKKITVFKNESSELKNTGQIVVVFQNGNSPKKVPNPSFHSIPEFKTQFNPITSALISVKSEEFSEEKETVVLQNIESDAILNLKEKWGGMLLKKLAGVAAKETLGNILNAKTGGRRGGSAQSGGGIGLGDLLKIGLYLTDEADLRSWSFLPKDLQIARFFVPEGTYTVTITPTERVDSRIEKVIQVGAGKTAITTFRMQ